jgi:hypothetical protein
MGGGTMKRLKWIGSVCILAFALDGALRAEDPSDLLEQAIYADETLRNRNLAIRLYTQIKDDNKSNPTTAAEALLRLGKCYLKDGRDKEAQEAFAELKKRFPDQKELIAGIPTDSSKRPRVFRSAPWENGEVLYYKETRGDFTDQFMMTTESSEQNKERIWKLRQIYIKDKSVITDVVDLMDSKFVPLKTKFKYQAGQLEGSLKFAPDRIEIQKHGRETGILPRRQNVYTGLMWLYRCLPLVEGYETDLSFLATTNLSSPAITNLLPSATDLSSTLIIGTSIPLMITLPPEFQIANCHIKVVDRKRIAVPAGTFDCFKIEITRTAAQLPAAQPPMVRMWISTQSPFYIVQQEILNKDSSSFMKLNSISRINRAQSDAIRDSGLDLSISTPLGWLVAASDEINSKSLILIDPECKSGGELQIDQQMGNNDQRETVALIVDQLIAELELISPPFYHAWSGIGFLMKNYRVRKDSRVSLDIPGAAATRFISEFQIQIQMNPIMAAQLQRPIDRIQYVYIYYFPMANRTYRLSLWTHPDNFEAMKPVFDKIANSLRMQ